MFDNPILNKLTENDIDYTVTKQGIKIEGFYKSGCITLIPLLNSNGYFISFKAIARYNDTRIITSFDDLVRFNYDWWMYSRDRGYDGWKNPDEKFANHFSRLGLITKFDWIFCESWRLIKD